MANFFLIDQSLRELGGHHHDYVRCVATAANEAGYLTTIGTHQKFRDTKSLESLGPIKRVFRETTYQRDSYLAGLRHPTRNRSDFLPTPPLEHRHHRLRDRFSLSNLTRIVRQAGHRIRRKRYIRNFAQDCERFFKSTLLTEHDHAFLTTVNEMEFMGLAAFLSNHPRTLQVHWHLQFHFNLFEGRTPEYPSQHRVAAAIQHCFDAALARIPYHNLQLYTTSETLADQFNSLGVGNFQVLTYPIRPELFGKREPARNQLSIGGANRPLRLTCPGEVRREKKMVNYLQPLIDRIWDNQIRPGNIQIVVQRPSRKWPAREKIKLQPPRHAVLSRLGAEWVKYYSHPLSDADYLDLIRNTDCGLLFYDSRAYFSRRAGVLGELLSCGKPVIVPAGSWLGDQLAEPNFRYVDSLCNSHNRRRSLQLEEITWSKSNVPLMGGVLSFDQREHPFELQFELEHDESGFVVEFDWHWPTNQGVYCKFEIANNPWESPDHGQIVGHRINGMSPVAYFPASQPSINLRMSNAFHDSTAGVRLIAIHTLAVDRASTPVGSVGLIAMGEEDIPRAINEMVEHYDHYRRTASQFAEFWYRQHEPKQTFSSLVATAVPLRRAA